MGKGKKVMKRVRLAFGRKKSGGDAVSSQKKPAVAMKPLLVQHISKTSSQNKKSSASQRRQTMPMDLENSLLNDVNSLMTGETESYEGYNRSEGPFDDESTYGDIESVFLSGQCGGDVCGGRYEDEDGMLVGHHNAHATLYSRPIDEATCFPDFAGPTDEDTVGTGIDDDVEMEIFAGMDNLCANMDDNYSAAASQTWKRKSGRKENSRKKRVPLVDISIDANIDAAPKKLSPSKTEAKETGIEIAAVGSDDESLVGVKFARSVDDVTERSVEVTAISSSHRMLSGVHIEDQMDSACFQVGSEEQWPLASKNAEATKITGQNSSFTNEQEEDDPIVSVSSRCSSEEEERVRNLMVQPASPDEIERVRLSMVRSFPDDVERVRLSSIQSKRLVSYRDGIFGDESASHESADDIIRHLDMLSSTKDDAFEFSYNVDEDSMEKLAERAAVDCAIVPSAWNKIVPNLGSASEKASSDSNRSEPLQNPKTSNDGGPSADTALPSTFRATMERLAEGEIFGPTLSTDACDSIAKPSSTVTREVSPGSLRLQSISPSKTMDNREVSKVTPSPTNRSDSLDTNEKMKSKKVDPLYFLAGVADSELNSSWEAFDTKIFPQQGVFSSSNSQVPKKHYVEAAFSPFETSFDGSANTSTDPIPFDAEQKPKTGQTQHWKLLDKAAQAKTVNEDDEMAAPALASSIDWDDDENSASIMSDSAVNTQHIRPDASGVAITVTTISKPNKSSKSARLEKVDRGRDKLELFRALQTVKVNRVPLKSPSPTFF